MISDSEKLQYLCDSFGIGTLESKESIAEGVLNLNYKLITDKGTYFAKGSGTRSETR